LWVKRLKEDKGFSYNLIQQILTIRKDQFNTA
jgi:hypothetical protein